MHGLARLAAAAALGAGLACSPAPGPAVGPDASEQTRATLEREVERLRAERELAREKGFYLKLDARSKRITLLLAGVTLQEHALDGIEIGVPRVAFLRRAQPSDWPFEAYRGGHLSPARERDRVEIVAPAPSPVGDAAATEPVPAPVPSVAEDAFSVPARYRIVFEGDLTLEVVAEDGGRNRSLQQRSADGLRLRAADLGNALRATPTERVRLRVSLEAADAATLYRSLPPEVGLIVVGVALD